MLNQCKYCGKTIDNYGWDDHQCDEWRSYQHDRALFKSERTIDNTSTNVNKQQENDNTAHTGGNNG